MINEWQDCGLFLLITIVFLAKRYCYMLITEGGVMLLHHIIQDESTHPSIKYFAELILQVLDAENPML